MYPVSYYTASVMRSIVLKYIKQVKLHLRFEIANSLQTVFQKYFNICNYLLPLGHNSFNQNLEYSQFEFHT